MLAIISYVLAKISSVLAKISSVLAILSSVLVKISSVLAIYSSVLAKISSVLAKISSVLAKISSGLVGNYDFVSHQYRYFSIKTSPLVALILFCRFLYVWLIYFWPVYASFNCVNTCTKDNVQQVPVLLAYLILLFMTRFPKSGLKHKTLFYHFSARLLNILYDFENLSKSAK